MFADEDGRGRRTLIRKIKQIFQKCKIKMAARGTFGESLGERTEKEPFFLAVREIYGNFVG